LAACTASHTASSRSDNTISTSTEPAPTGATPGVPIRAFWLTMDSYPTAKDAGIKNINAVVDDLQKAKINRVFLWVTSRYVETERNPAVWGPRSPDPVRACHSGACLMATWHAMREFVSAAHARHINVDVWYSPNDYKPTHDLLGQPPAPERIDHPEWQVAYRDGELHDFEIDYASDEMQRYELGVIDYLLATTHADGIQIEEPLYQADRPATSSAADSEISYSSSFVAKFIDRFGQDPRQVAELQRRADMATLKRELITRFLSSVRTMLKSKYASALVSVSSRESPPTASDFVTPDFEHEGADYLGWIRNGLLDYIAPEDYYTAVGPFTTVTHQQFALLGAAFRQHIIVGIAAPSRRGQPWNQHWLDFVSAEESQNVSWSIFNYRLLDGPSIEQLQQTAASFKSP